MGYYIQTDGVRNKALFLVKKFGGQVVQKPKSFAEIPENKALIVVIDNGVFEAAGLIYSKGEFAEFTSPYDMRPRQYVLLDKETAYRESGYQE